MYPSSHLRQGFGIRTASNKSGADQKPLTSEDALDSKEPTWENVVDVVKRARSSSWIKQNSVQSFNKRCPQLFRRLWKLLKVMGMKKIIEKRQQDKPVKNNILPKCRGLNFSVLLYWQGD